MQDAATTICLLYWLYAFTNPYHSPMSFESRIDALLKSMTLAEKIGQTSQRNLIADTATELKDETLEAIRAGHIGSVLNVSDPDTLRTLQNTATQESRLGIPLIFGRDVIHGFKTMFPIPLAQAASWNEDIIEQSARIAAEEASSQGLHWTFAPMVDISRDARWGRIAESFGEDPYLCSVCAHASIKGYQTDDLTQATSIAACAKHFVGYGAAEGGRDYNTVTIDEHQLRDIYLKPFKAAADANVATMMSSFSDLNGIPPTGNKFLLTQILRKEWNYQGFVVSDWDSVAEMIQHGFAADRKHAAQLAANAGLDMEMYSSTFEDYLGTLIEEGICDETQLDNAVRNILRIKFQLGLFDTPNKQHNAPLLSPAALATAKQAAIESCVLLKNNNKLLPLSNNKALHIAVTGPMADAPHEQLGTWTFDGNKQDSQTPLNALTTMLGQEQVHYAAGLDYSRSHATDGFQAAIDAAAQSDVILCFVGEEAILSGEAHSRTDIALPGAQNKLIKALHQTGKPLVLILMTGRPVILKNIIDLPEAILCAWHPGTMAGPALADLLFGLASPSGRLPISWPQTTGQVPLYYNHKNTGRPPNPEEYVLIDDIPLEASQISVGGCSFYQDIGTAPLFPFGFGLSYTDFSYDLPTLQQATISLQELDAGKSITVSVNIKNTGERSGIETAQCYIRDVVADIIRPIRELKHFARISLAPGEQQQLSFNISKEDLAFHNQLMQYIVEPGEFNIWLSPDAESGQAVTFHVTP